MFRAMSDAVSAAASSRAKDGGEGSGRPLRAEPRPVPDQLTLRLLSVVAFVTLACWLSAKVACNRKEAPLREPSPLTDEQLRRTAKSTAIEFAQRFAERRYEGAAAFATGPAEAWVRTEAARCAGSSDGSGCEPLRDPHTRAVYLHGGRRGATLRTEAYGAEGVEVSELFVVRQPSGQPGQRGWAVAERRAEGGLGAPLEKRKAVGAGLVGAEGAASTDPEAPEGEASSSPPAP